MRGTPRIRRACVQFADPAGPQTDQIGVANFTRECRQSALARFSHARTAPGTCHTIDYLVPPKYGDAGATGSIVAHLSPRMSEAWQKQAHGPVQVRRWHVEAQMRLALEDLGLQDIHGLLAMTPAQREAYKLDLDQLVAEVLQRTDFWQLGIAARTRWEGTLVERLRPPFVILVFSVDLVPATTRARMDHRTDSAQPSRRR